MRIRPRRRTVVDLPYAVIRRHLAAGQPIKPRTVRLVTRAAQDLMKTEIAEPP